MNPPKCNAEDYIQWLIASPKVVSCTEAAKSSPKLIAHDAYTRLLERLKPKTSILWDEVSPLVSLQDGWLIIDEYHFG